MIYNFSNNTLDSQRARKVLIYALRHGIVSVVCGSIDLLTLYYLVDRLHLLVYFSYVISFCISTVIGYMFHSLYTFRAPVTYKTLILYMVQIFFVLGFGYTVYSLAYFIVNSVVYAKAFQLCITFVVNLAIGRYITFANKREV